MLSIMHRPQFIAYINFLHKRNVGLSHPFGYKMKLEKCIDSNSLTFITLFYVEYYFVSFNGTFELFDEPKDFNSDNENH